MKLVIHRLFFLSAEPFFDDSDRGSASREEKIVFLDKQCNMYLYREIWIKMHGVKREEGENGNAAFHSESSVQADSPICGSIEKGIWNEPCFVAGEQFHRMMPVWRKK